MNKLPSNVKPKDLVKALERMGFVKVGGKGSHVRLKHMDGRWTQVAVHAKPIPTGTLRAILHQEPITKLRADLSLGLPDQ